VDDLPATRRTSRFRDLADGGRALAPLVVAGGPYDDPVVLAVAPHGGPAGGEVAAALGREAVPLTVTRDADGVRVPRLPELAGRVVIVVDDGVETGTAALAIGDALREVGVARSVLAVPVCPKEAEAALSLRYDTVVAVVRPLVRRDLRWHYATLG
jgi:predicted phosphoribosyltransferase